MRGKDSVKNHVLTPPGITPAYAGKSLNVRVSDFLIWDHPRLCGEKGTRTERKSLPAGSPPPMRGKGYVWRLKGTFSRITPAYAGKRIDRKHYRTAN